MNVYDFDKTIYRNDSTFDFFLFCLKNEKKTALSLPKTALYGVGYLLHIVEKTVFKEVFFEFLQHLKNTDEAVTCFWNENRTKIKSWYLHQQRTDDVIISASPEFLLRPVCAHATLIGSQVDSKTGKFNEKNCYGEEKVVRLSERLPDFHISAFYSDSLSDTPLALLAEQAYLVKGNTILPWPKTNQ